ncbi:MAG: type II toxin-antitoxin system VapC family toxin [Spirochaetota bacterium]
MVLVDTSIWIRHLRYGVRYLEYLLDESKVACHHFVIGELACGSIGNRDEVLALMQALPRVVPVDDNEILHFIDANLLMGRGIGLIDVHLLASCKITQCLLWTSDKKLFDAASEMSLAFTSPKNS